MSTFNEAGSETASTAVWLNNTLCHGRGRPGEDLAGGGRDEIFAMPETELMRALQNATENVLRLAGENFAAKRNRAPGPVGHASLEQQHSLAQHLIDRLLTLSAART
jgi:hypothetical protein